MTHEQNQGELAAKHSHQRQPSVWKPRRFSKLGWLQVRFLPPRHAQACPHKTFCLPHLQHPLIGREGKNGLGQGNYESIPRTGLLMMCCESCQMILVEICSCYLQAVPNQYIAFTHQLVVSRLLVLVQYFPSPFPAPLEVEFQDRFFAHNTFIVHENERRKTEK